MVMIETQDLPRQMMQRANEEIERLRQQLDMMKDDLMMANEAAKESWDQAKALEQQLAGCEQQRDSNYDEMQRARAELKESIRERNAFQDQCISLKMKMTVMREERDELAEDAVRYRWLLTQQVENEELRWMSYTYTKEAYPNMDAAIDAVMKGGE